MRDFAGCEPLVGEIVALRTFRVEESGLLLPLYSAGTWYDGVNTAVCAPPTGHHPRGTHAVPADDCECGFYAYGSPQAAARNRHGRYVQAVVSCWGGVVAGTQGVRAEHARVDALWLSPDAPAGLRERVSSRYPSARLYDDVQTMLADHPLSELPCYEPAAGRRRAALVASVLAALAVMSLGLLPLGLLHGHETLWAAWLFATIAAGGFTAWLLVGTHDAGHLAAAFVMAGVLGWLVAPLFGAAGWILRVPLLRGLAVAGAGYLIALWPHHFPVVKAARERAFCGVSA
jgi:hypothetical protein